MRHIFFSLGLLFLTSCGVDKSLLVTNSSSIDRVGEIVEVDIDNPDEYVVYSDEGDILQCQTTYDGKLIFPATVAAESTQKYILRKGRRLAVDTIATGKVYPQWFNDFGWENDKIGFRTYSMEMAKRGGAVLSGYDIFTKRYDRPVLDNLYGTQFDHEYQAILKRLRAEKSKLVSQLSASITYHVDHGFGMDYYIVGPTLGSGTAALLDGEDILYPAYYSECEILDKGGLRLTFRLTLDPVEVDGEKIQEVRTITLDKGTHFNHIEVEYKNLTNPRDIVIGLVMHDDGKVSSRGDGFIAYAEPKHEYGWQIYNAVIYPAETSNEVKFFDKPIGAAEGHILTNGRYTPGTPLNYYMGAAWNRWGFKTPEAWFSHVEKQSKALAEPLTCEIK